MTRTFTLVLDDLSDQRYLRHAKFFCGLKNILSGQYEKVEKFENFIINSIRIWFTDFRIDKLLRVTRNDIDLSKVMKNNRSTIAQISNIYLIIIFTDRNYRCISKFVFFLNHSHSFPRLPLL